MALNGQRGAGMVTPRLYPVPVAGLSSGIAVDGAAGPVTLAAGETFVLPAGTYLISVGAYTYLQVKDPIVGTWRTVSQAPNATHHVQADGVNMRLANLTGCALGALITNVGTGYTSVPVVTPSAGSSVWKAILGGAINSTVIINTAGVGYVHAPQLLISGPPDGGVQATAIATVTGGAITGVTVINQGAGYTKAPTITILPDPRDTITTQAALAVNATLAGAGTITALVCLDHGTPLTSVPTLAITGGGGASGAATAIMCLTATGFTVDAAGVAYGATQTFAVITTGGVVATAPGAVVNPQLDKGILVPRQANIKGTTTGGAVITATGLQVMDGGLFSAVPNGLVIPSGTGAIPTTAAVVTITVGGVTDTSLVYPI